VVASGGVRWWPAAAAALRPPTCRLVLLLPRLLLLLIVVIVVCDLQAQLLLNVDGLQRRAGGCGWGAAIAAIACAGGRTCGRHGPSPRRRLDRTSSLSSCSSCSSCSL